MRSSRVFVPGVLTLSVLLFTVPTPPLSSLLYAQEKPSSAPQSSQTQQEPQAQEPQAQDQETGDQQEAPAVYDKSIFQNPIPADHLALLKRFDGQSSDKLFRDKQFQKLMKSFVPDCEFHYGRDMPLDDALDAVMRGSSIPVAIRDGRYLTLSGHMGPYLAGKAFLWIDLQDGIGLGAFYFHPTNGEPTPVVNVFSRQISDEPLKMSQMPPAFAEDLNRWTADARIPTVTARYFITGSRRKIILEHDEEYCAAANGPAPDNCMQLNADAADLDLTAAYYVDQTNHTTNATAWMISGEQTQFVRVRDTTCGIAVACRIHLTRVRIGVVVHRGVPVHAHVPVRVTRK